MKKFFKSVLVFFSVLILAQGCFAVDVSSVGASSDAILVLPDNLQFESTNYFIYPDSSVIFASDTINCLKKSGRVEIVSMQKVRDAFRKNVHMQLLAKSVLKEYKYNYNVSFVGLKELAKAFSTNKVLLITSTTDAQNFVLRRTLWDFLNIPGATVIDPAYKLYTYAALVDVDKEEVLWQKTYHKTISSVENRIVANNFAPATEQLERIKFYSEYYLAPEIAGVVQSKLAPPLLLPAGSTELVDVNATKDLSGQIVTPVTSGEFEVSSKTFVPITPRQKQNGVMVNDL